MSWPLLLVVSVLIPLVGQLAAFLVVRPARVGGGRFMVWVPVVGLLMMASQRAISPGRRVAAIAAGAAGSYLAVALLVLIGLLVRGEVVTSRPAVKAVRPGAPAEGILLVGDRIDRAQDVPLEPGRPSLVQHVDRSEGRPVVLDIVRGGEAREVELTPAIDPQGVYRIGVELTYVDQRARPGLASAAGSALAEPARRARAILRALKEVIAGTEQAEFMGPVGIADTVRRTDESRYFEVVVLLSIYGLLGLLPLVLALTVVALVTRDKVGA